MEELERIDAHESGRTSGTGGKNHGCIDVIERPDQPSDAHESGRSLPTQKGQRTKNNRVITLRRGHNQKPSCDASDCGCAGQSKDRERAMQKNAQSREALQTPNLPAGMDKTAQTWAALQTPGLTADPFHNSTLTCVGRITRSMVSARTAETDVMVSALMSIAIDGDPDTYEEAMASDEKELWKTAIREECTSIIRNKTFAQVSNSTGRIPSRPIGSEWVFKTKRNPDGTIQYKVRLVIKGYM